MRQLARPDPMAWPRWCTGISRLEFAFVLVAISTGCVSLLFNTFHVTLFRSVYGLDPAAFAAGHAVYAVWNTANDLGSGWVADMLAARNGSRVPLVRVGGLLWVTVGFLFPWWRWAFLPLPVQVRRPRYAASRVCLCGILSSARAVCASALAL